MTIPDPAYQVKWNEIYKEVQEALPLDAPFQLKWELTWNIYKKYMDSINTIITSVPYTLSNAHLDEPNIMSQAFGELVHNTRTGRFRGS